MSREAISSKPNKKTRRSSILKAGAVLGGVAALAAGCNYTTPEGKHARQATDALLLGTPVNVLENGAVRVISDDKQRPPMVITNPILVRGNWVIQWDSKKQKVVAYQKGHDDSIKEIQYYENGEPVSEEKALADARSVLIETASKHNVDPSAEGIVVSDAGKIDDGIKVGVEHDPIVEVEYPDAPAYNYRAAGSQHESRPYVAYEQSKK